MLSERGRRKLVDIRHNIVLIGQWLDGMSLIAGGGNVYRHDYEDVNERLIWRTARTALPPLLAAVEAELADDAQASRP